MFTLSAAGTTTTASININVLIVDDDQDLLQSMAELLASNGYRVTTAGSAEDALERLREDTFHLVLCDFQLPGRNGISLLKIIHESCPATVSVLITGHGSVRTAVTALKRGAVEYMQKPVKPSRLLTLCRVLTAHAPEFLPNKLLVSETTALTRFEGMVARSRIMQSAFVRIELAAHAVNNADSTVLLVGESGTGKELAAGAIHRRSVRASGPFVGFNTGAIPKAGIAEALFGDESNGQNPRRIDLAEGGTLFIDDVTALDNWTQQALLHFLETGEFARAGTQKAYKADVRIVAAVNRSVDVLVDKGLLHRDLAYRLDGFAIQLPPLRERTEDIAPLAADFLVEFAGRYQLPVPMIPADTLGTLTSYAWPGNVRELRNVIEQALLQGVDHTLAPSLLPEHITRLPRREELIKIRIGTPMDRVEREVILRTLDAHRGNKTAAAETLGISRRSIYNKLAEYGEKVTRAN